MNTTTKETAGWTVRSCNFSWHEPVPAASYAEALKVARSRGWDARIELDGQLVAVWSALYGTHVYSRQLAV